MAAATTRKKRKTVGRVMHEFKHGELKRSSAGKGGKVKSRKQAIAIALSEAGSSNKASTRKNRKNFRRTRAKERRGETAQQEAEGRFGASGHRKSTGSRKKRTVRSGARKARRNATARRRK